MGKSLNDWLKSLSTNSLITVTENERYELLKYGVNALDKLTVEKQVEVCAIYSSIFKK